VKPVRVAQSSRLIYSELTDNPAQNGSSGRRKHESTHSAESGPGDAL
jgi:hypothetical protein